MAVKSTERYRIIEPLGAGGMAAVFLATDTTLGRRVAVKRLPAASPRDLALRFQREARLGASLNHHNLVSIFDTVAGDDGLLIVMEYVEGEDLRRALRRGPMTPAEAIGVLRQVAAGLDHAHRYRVVHRDVKPANILMGANGVVKLADLGIALAVASEASRLTASGAVLGTPSYMAPEQFEDGEITPAVDVYALAAVAFEALSGRRSQTGTNALEIAHRIVDEPPPDLRDAWPQAPAEAAKALRDAMAHDPAKRPGSACALVDALGTTLERSARARGRARGRSAIGAPQPAREAARGPAADNAADDAAPRRARRPASVGGATGDAAPRGGRRRVAIAGALAVLLAGLGALAAALVVSPEHRPGHPASDNQAGVAVPRATRPGSRQAPTAAGAGSSHPGAATSGGTATPSGAVRAFYARQAAHRYNAAWALADPSFRYEESNFDAFVGQSRTLRSITFQRADTVSSGDNRAVVAIKTTAVHTDRTDHCAGTVEAVPASDGDWRLHHIDVQCTQ